MLVKNLPFDQANITSIQSSKLVTHIKMLQIIPRDFVELQKKELTKKVYHEITCKNK